MICFCCVIQAKDRRLAQHMVAMYFPEEQETVHEDIMVASPRVACFFSFDELQVYFP